MEFPKILGYSDQSRRHCRRRNSHDGRCCRQAVTRRRAQSPAKDDPIQKHADAIAASQLTEQGATVGLGAAAGATAGLAVVGGSAAAATAADVDDKAASSSAYRYLQNTSDYEDLLSKYDTFLFDCDGVLWSGDDTIPVPSLSSKSCASAASRSSLSPTTPPNRDRPTSRSSPA